jgi:hypothetical protein
MSPKPPRACESDPNQDTRLRDLSSFWRGHSSFSLRTKSGVDLAASTQRGKPQSKYPWPGIGAKAQRARRKSFAENAQFSDIAENRVCPASVDGEARLSSRICRLFTGRHDFYSFEAGLGRYWAISVITGRIHSQQKNNFFASWRKLAQFTSVNPEPIVAR